MDVKEAVAKAKEWFQDIMREEQYSNLGLEEVEFDDRNKLWKITLGFTRPWTRNSMSAITGVDTSRAYRLITIKDDDGRAISMTRKLASGN